MGYAIFGFICYWLGCFMGYRIACMQCADGQEEKLKQNFWAGQRNEINDEIDFEERDQEIKDWLHDTLGPWTKMLIFTIAMAFIVWVFVTR